MASSVESLLKEAGVAFELPSDPMVIRGADAIFNGDLSSLALDVGEDGDLLVDLDILSETLKEEIGPEVEIGGEDVQAIRIKEEKGVEVEMVEDAEEQNFEEEDFEDKISKNVRTVTNGNTKSP